MLEDREQELRNLMYNPRLPIDIVFKSVEDYIDFAELAAQPCPHSDRQLQKPTLS